MLPGDHDEVYYRDDEERALAVAKADYVAGRISVYEFEDMVGAILAGEPNVVAVGMATAPERR